jgi:hypothetical protein
MSERTALSKIFLSAAVAALLAIVPFSIQAQEVTQPSVQSGKSTARSAKPSTTGETKKKDPTPGQLAARERQKKCGAEWRETKAKLDKDMTWPKFWSACNKRLKEQSA